MSGCTANQDKLYLHDAMTRQAKFKTSKCLATRKRSLLEYKLLILIIYTPVQSLSMANRKTSHCRDRQAEFKERMDTVFRDSEQLSLLGGGAYVLSMVFQPHRRQWHLFTSTNAPDNVWPFSMNEFVSQKRLSSVFSIINVMTQSQAAHDPATTDSLNGDGFETGTLTTSKFESGRRSIPIESILNPESEVESKFTAPTCHESGHNVNHVGVEALPRSSLRGRSIVLEPDLNPDSEVQGNTTTAINPKDSMTDKSEAQFTVAWVMPSSVKPYSRWRSGQPSILLISALLTTHRLLYVPSTAKEV